MLKSIIEFCLVHLAVSEQVGGHLWLGVQNVNASVQGLKEFVLQGLRQFTVEFGGQVPYFVESGIVHVFQFVGVVGVLLYHHNQFLVMIYLLCHLSFNSRSISSMLGNVPLNSAG